MSVAGEKALVAIAPSTKQINRSARKTQSLGRRGSSSWPVTAKLTSLRTSIDWIAKKPSAERFATSRRICRSIAWASCNRSAVASP
ncbi:MAG: hypothetical protein ACYTFH_09890 [Planctomycetota bacterium]